MKKILFTLYGILLLFTFSIVNAEVLKKTNEIKWETDDFEYAYSNNYKYEEDYIYTEFDFTSSSTAIKVVRKDSSGEIVWEKKFNDVSSEDHDILLLDDKLYLTIQNQGTYILSLKNGSTSKETTKFSGIELQEYNGNIVVFDYKTINIVSKDFDILATTVIDDVFSKTEDSKFNLFDVEDDEIYVLSWDSEKEKHFLLTLDDSLKQKSKVELTYDDNQGFLSDEGYFDGYYRLIKFGENFYQIGYDMYKITPTGKTTIVIDSYELDSNNNYHVAYDAEEINGNLVLAKVLYNNNTDDSYVHILILDSELNEISSKRVALQPSNVWSWVQDVSITEEGFIVRWYEYYYTIDNYISEYKNVEVEPSCKIISGDGTNIGDEIQCGTENFYVLENDGKNIKMLAKYNLYIGKQYDKILFSETFDTLDEAKDYWSTHKENNGQQIHKYLTDENNKYTGIMVYTELEYDSVLQNENALGAHGGSKGEPEFPEVGVYDYDLDLFQLTIPSDDIYEDDYQDYGLGYSDFYYYLSYYKSTLEELGVYAELVDMLTVKEINELVYKTSGEYLPLAKWAAEWDWSDSQYSDGYNDTYLILGSIKEYTKEEYSWIWGTTYWTKTATEDHGQIYFVDTLGNLCLTYSCNGVLGAGIRPVVTIATSEIKYNIITKTDGNGTITPSKNFSSSGEDVTFTVTPNKGYVLGEVKVTDSAGNIIIFTDYTFTMPSADVTIEAHFTKVVPNPPTSAINIGITIILCGISFMISKKYMKKTISFILMFFAFIGITNAQGCVVISGNGYNIGDEIACGTEHFYVISNDGKNVKMLAKYNLMAGSNYNYIDYNSLVTKDYYEIFKNKELKEKMYEGYRINSENYTYNETTEEYTIKGILLKQDYQIDHKTIIFDSYLTTAEEAIKTKESKEVLELGYKFESVIENSENQIIGINFEKDKGYEYKTIFVDKQKRTPIELMNVKEVKESLANGYRAVISYGTYDEEFFGYTTQTQRNTGEREYDFYYITLYKNDYYEYKSIIFDNNMTSTEAQTYIENNEEIQKEIEKYKSLSYYFDGLSYSYNKNYYGIVLSNEKTTAIEEFVKQDSKAIGAHGAIRGVPEFPEYAGFVGSDLYDDLYEALENNPSYGNGGYIDYDLNNDSDILQTLQKYDLYLNSLDIKTLDINLLAISEIDEIVENITGEHLPLEQWTEEWKEEYNIREEYGNIYIIGSLIDYIPEEYSWLWGTTYWTRTQSGEAISNYIDSIYFVDTWGDICSADYCEVEVGAGLRPVVTILSADLLYNIETKTDGNGTVTSSATNEHSGNEVTFEVIPNEGYVLKEITVIDKDGNEITFTDYKFTMPSADVIIEAKFEVENPPTTPINISLAIILSLISMIIFTKYKKKITN